MSHLFIPPAFSSSSPLPLSQLRRQQLSKRCRVRKRLRTCTCATAANESPSGGASPQQQEFTRYGVLTDSVLEIKWRFEQRPPASASSSTSALPAFPDDDAVCYFDETDLSASDPYKSFARFTRIAAPTASLGMSEAPRNVSYSSAAIVQRLLQYAFSKDNLERFLKWFTGEFDNYDQIYQERLQGIFPREGGGHEHIHCSIKQIAPDLLFAKYYFNGNSQLVFRSRLYQVRARDDSERGVIEMRIFRFYEETERSLKAANYDIDAIQWDRNDVYDWMQGCEVFWERYVPPEDQCDEACQALGIEAGARFVGYMKGGGCEVYSREIGTRIRVMDDLLLTSDDLWVADRGFDLDDQFIYGNRLGVPYKMRRVTPGSSCEWTVSKQYSPPEDYIS
ncbi:chromophore lyase CpcT/CpeT [Gracilaria domingensis]|nr:chromophore lyase CpcT/CpeT [Gracilaria domingensis]